VAAVLLKRAVAQGMTMIPTLKMFSEDDNIAEIRRVVRRFHEVGGRLAFGTDTGYVADYDVTEEFGQLTKAGFTGPLSCECLLRVRRACLRSRTAEGKSCPE